MHPFALFVFILLGQVLSSAANPNSVCLFVFLAVIKIIIKIMSLIFISKSHYKPLIGLMHSFVIEKYNFLAFLSLYIQRSN
jgi:hypothetical protein